MDLSKSESLERVEKILPKLHWQAFPGVQSLLLKVSIKSYFNFSFNVARIFGKLLLREIPRLNFLVGTYWKYFIEERVLNAFLCNRR